MIREELITVTLDDAKANVRALLLRTPEAINPMEYGHCKYVQAEGSEETHEAPNCIAGAFYRDLGVDQETLKSFEGSSAKIVARGIPTHVFDDEVGNWLDSVQRIADGGGCTALGVNDEYRDSGGICVSRPWGVVFSLLHRVGEL